MPGIGSIAQLASQAVAAQSAAAQQSNASSQITGNNGNNFGPSSTVTLSPSAQAALAGTSSGSGSSAAGSSKTPAPPVRVAVSSSTTTDSATLIEEAYQQVIPKVGVTGASEVVDSQGNINEVKLNELILQSYQTTTAQA